MARLVRMSPVSHAPVPYTMRFFFVPWQAGGERPEARDGWLQGCLAADRRGHDEIEVLLGDAGVPRNGPVNHGFHPGDIGVYRGHLLGTTTLAVVPVHLGAAGVS